MATKYRQVEVRMGAIRVQLQEMTAATLASTSRTQAMALISILGNLPAGALDHEQRGLLCEVCSTIRFLPVDMAGVLSALVPQDGDTKRLMRSKMQDFRNDVHY